MRSEDFKKLKSLMDEFSKHQTWTTEKKKILMHVYWYIESGTHEYFFSRCQSHVAYVGEYYLEEENHKRRGTLKKYRGKKVLVMCVGHGSYHVRKFVVATIEENDPNLKVN